MPREPGVGHLGLQDVTPGTAMYNTLQVPAEEPNLKSHIFHSRRHSKGPWAFSCRRNTASRAKPPEPDHFSETLAHFDRLRARVLFTLQMF